MARFSFPGPPGCVRARRPAEAQYATRHFGDQRRRHPVARPGGRGRGPGALGPGAHRRAGPPVDRRGAQHVRPPQWPHHPAHPARVGPYLARVRGGRHPCANGAGGVVRVVASPAASGGGRGQRGGECGQRRDHLGYRGRRAGGGRIGRARAGRVVGGRLRASQRARARAGFHHRGPFRGPLRAGGGHARPAAGGGHPQD